jgi:CspA family cold shock protein
LAEGPPAFTLYAPRAGEPTEAADPGSQHRCESEHYMPTGTVKFFNTDKGYGFIVQDGGGPDIFVHISEVERSGLRTLSDGQKVSFETKMDPRKGKPNAVNIKAA